MPGKTNKKSKATKTKNAKKAASKQAATPAAAPVEAAPVEAAPVEAAPVEAAPAAAPVAAAAPKQTGGAKGKKQKAAAASATPSATATPSKKAKASKGKTTKKAAAKVVETEQVTEAFTETATATEAADTENGRRTRSFKVLLPNSTEYEGRFTGLTPYQAANKALSKYYRETNKPQKEITFSIKESTRGSKRSVYTYNGRREKLDTPVEYAIKDGRTIVKHYKNRLTKVKKNDTSGTATETATATA